MRRYRGAGIALILLLLGLATLSARSCQVASLVFPSAGEVRLTDTDSYYHLRHARASARHFPSVQRWDHGTHYPRGRPSPTAGLWDLSLAGAALAFGLGDPEAATFERVAAWSAPLMALAFLLALFVLVRRLSDSRTALLACALLVVFPGELLDRTTLGNADHHAAEVLLGMLSMWTLVRCLQEEVHHPRPWYRPALASSLPLAALHFTWAGAPIYLVLIGLGLLVTSAVRLSASDEDPAWARAVFRYGLGFVILVGVPAGCFPSLVMKSGTLVGILSLGVGLALVFPVATWIGARLVGRGVPRLVLGPALLLAALGAGAIAVKLLPGAQSLLDTLVVTKPSIVSEQAAVSWQSVWHAYGLLWVTSLVALPWALARAPGERKAACALLVTLFGLGLSALWWRSHDYGYALAPWLALMSAYGARALFGRLGRSFSRSRPWTSAAVALLAVAVLLAPIWPLRAVAPPLMTPQRLARLMILDEGWVQALRWMSAKTPAPSLPIDARVEPFGEDFSYPEGAYGVMAAWDFGSFISALGQRPPVASQGVTREPAAWLLSPDERSSLTQLRSGCEDGERIRYVMLDARTLTSYFPAELDVVGKKLGEYASVQGRGQLGGQPVKIAKFNQRYHQIIAARLYIQRGDELTRYRLVYESPHQSLTAYLMSRRGDGRFFMAPRAYPLTGDADEDLLREAAIRPGFLDTPRGLLYGGEVHPTVRLFEVVAGAVLVGDVPPGAEVQARLKLRSTTTGAAWTYTQRAPVDAAGRYRLTLPYATEPVPISDVQADGLVELVLTRPDQGRGVVIGEVAITEEQVQRGAQVRIPNPVAPAAATAEETHVP